MLRILAVTACQLGLQNTVSTINPFLLINISPNLSILEPLNCIETNDGIGVTASENWDDDFEDDGLGPGSGEVIVPPSIQARQQKLLHNLDSVKEFAALVEGL